MAEWKPGIVYLRVTPKIGERPFVSMHRCWNMDRFIDSQRDAYNKEGGAVQVITEADYRRELCPKG